MPYFSPQVHLHSSKQGDISSSAVPQHSSVSSSIPEDERLKSDIVFQSEWEIARKLREIRQRLSTLRSQNIKQKLMAIKVGLH